MANLVIRGFIDGGNDNTESITNGVGASPRGCHTLQDSTRCHGRRDAVDAVVRAGFRNDISYGSIAPPVTYVPFVVFIVLMKAATVYAMRGLKQAK